MRIAILAPITQRVPPLTGGPVEQEVALLVDGLVARGVAVTLFATADARTEARLAGACPRPLAVTAALDPAVWTALHLAALFERAGEFDLIHNHCGFPALAFSRLVATPMLTTIYAGVPGAELPIYLAYAGAGAYVAVSDATRHPALSYRATINPGVDLRRLTPRAQPDDYLLVLGAIHPAHGVAEAIEVASRCGQRLLLAGQIADEAYFLRRVEPLLDDDRVRYLGPVGAAQHDGLLGGATALLQLDAEGGPFGLAALEAMACGTPVITFERAGGAEYVRHGATGFVVRTLDGAANAVLTARRLDRVAIRRYAAARFSHERLADEYLRLYRDLLGAHSPPDLQERAVGVLR